MLTYIAQAYRALGGPSAVGWTPPGMGPPMGTGWWWWQALYLQGQTFFFFIRNNTVAQRYRSYARYQNKDQATALTFTPLTRNQH